MAIGIVAFLGGLSRIVEVIGGPIGLYRDQSLKCQGAR